MHEQALRTIHINTAHFKLSISILNIKIKEGSVTYRSFALQLTFEQHWFELQGPLICGFFSNKHYSTTRSVVG